MEDETLRYADHYDIIVALVTYLALCNHGADPTDKSSDNANADWLAETLGLPEAEVTLVLENYKSLFRRSQEPYKGKYRYTLLLRYSHRNYQRPGGTEFSAPLADEELFALLAFVSNKVAMEQAEQQQRENSRNQMIAMLVAALSAVVAAAASIVSVLIG